MYTAEISVSGHLIDSGLLLRVFDSVANLGGEFKILDTEFGKTKEDKGRAIIQVGADTCEELDEILDLSDRVAVIFKGQIQKVLDRKDANRRSLGILMAGVKDDQTV